MQPDYDKRILFLSDLDVMEADFSDFTFTSPADVHAFYDELDARIAATGRKWFFLVNYRDCHIYPEAWITFANRGKKLNLAWSLGSVRYAARPETEVEIEARAEAESFDPNLFASRDAALAEIARMRAAKLKPKTAASVSRAECESRLGFLLDERVFDVDFSDFTFTDAATVHAFYDVIDFTLWKTASSWYFLVNYSGCKIMPEAWASFARRGKQANQKHSLGTVRYDASPETAEEIRRKADTEDFDPNLCADREAALRRIMEMRATG